MDDRTYEIRFFKSEGALSLVMCIDCLDDNDAHRAAMKMFASEFEQFQIWRGGECINTERRVGVAA
jgi:hypothetical protein